MEWPDKKADGSFKTTETAQEIWKAANGGVEYQGKNWRKDYANYVVDSVQAQVKDPVNLCKAGLKCAHENFKFRVGDELLSLEEAFQREWDPLESEIHRGKGPDQHTFKLASPCGTDEEPIWLEPDDAVKQLKAYVDYGCVEPSVMDAGKVYTTTDATPYVKDKTFCLLGLTSELGPAKMLLKLSGSYVMGVSRGGSKVKDLVDYVQSESPSNATLHILKEGGDLLNQAPQIAKWIVSSAPKDRKLVLLPLVYMDGEANVRATVAMDYVIEYVMKHRKDVELAYYTSPATAYPIPTDAALDAKRRQEAGSTWSKVVKIVSFGSVMRSSDVWEQEEPIIFNGIANLQGPNYCLAKSMQQWRCIVAHAEGLKVAAPHAPPSRTYSVQHNPSAAAGLEGMQYLPPLVSFDVLPCSSLMTGIILQQLSEPRKEFDNPFELFWEGAAHGGSWRLPFDLDSCMVVAYLIGQTVSKQGTSWLYKNEELWKYKLEK